MLRGATLDRPTRIVNRQTSSYDVYIGRPSRWGNPFTHRPDVAAKHPDLVLVDSLKEAIERYEEYLVLDRPDLLDELDELKGRTLGCWCKPGPCHGDVLVKLIDSLS